MLSLPLTSIIIPTYNRADELFRCLHSLTKQTNTDFEVLVCDDGSTDHTHYVVNGFKTLLRICYLRQENFGGPARPRNNGLQHACGEYVAFLDSDDWWHPEKLEQSVRHLDAGADIVYHDLFLAKLYEKGFGLLTKRLKTRQLNAPVFDDLLVKGNGINTSSVVVKRELMLEIGGFSEDSSLIAGEDYEAWLRLSKITDNFKKIKGVFGYYWAGGGNISASPNRTLAIISKLEDIYGHEFNRVSGNVYPPLWAYQLARAHFKKGSYKKSAKCSAMALRGDLSFFFKIKALYTLSVSGLMLLINTSSDH